MPRSSTTATAAPGIAASASHSGSVSWRSAPISSARLDGAVTDSRRAGRDPMRKAPPGSVTASADPPDTGLRLPELALPDWWCVTSTTDARRVRYTPAYLDCTASCGAAKSMAERRSDIASSRVTIMRHSPFATFWQHARSPLADTAASTRCRRRDVVPIDQRYVEPISSDCRACATGCLSLVRPCRTNGCTRCRDGRRQMGGRGSQPPKSLLAPSPFSAAEGSPRPLTLAGLNGCRYIDAGSPASELTRCWPLLDPNPILCGDPRGQASHEALGPRR